MPASTLMVTFDSVEPRLVRQWTAEGELPSLRTLLEGGHVREIENLRGLGNGVFWPCIYTGYDPSFHGGYYLRAPMPPDFALKPFTKFDYVLPPFWKALDEEGLEVVVIDPVECPVAGLANGIELIDWLVHRREGPPFSTPPELIDHILARYGDDPFEGNIDRTLRLRMTAEALSEVSARRIASKTDAALELLAQRDWDVFILSYPDAHDIGHAAWHLHDPDTAPGAVSPAASAGADPLMRCYAALDEALGRLIPAAGPDARIFVVMGPGMERNATANALLPDVLRAFQGRRRRGLKRQLSRAARAFAESEWIPWGVRQHFRDHRARIGADVQTREGVRYFSVPHNDNAGAVRINLAGREPHGVVQPGRDYDALCDELSGRLLDLRDAGGRVPAVSEVIKLHDCYHGPELARLPDLLVVWNRQADLSAMGSDVIGVFRKARPTPRSGDHSARGLLLSDAPLEGAAEGVLTPMQVTPILVDAARAAAVA